MNAHDRLTPLAGRTLISVIFLLSGVQKLTNFSGMAGFLSSKHLRLPNVALALAIFIEFVGALCLIFGFQTRIAAWIMFLYLIPATLVFHNFWAMQGSMQQDMMIHFLKNLAIMGGLLMVAAYGPGKIAVGAKKSP